MNVPCPSCGGERLVLQKCAAYPSLLKQMQEKVCRACYRAGKRYRPDGKPKTVLVRCPDCRTSRIVHHRTFERYGTTNERGQRLTRCRPCSNKRFEGQVRIGEGQMQGRTPESPATLQPGTEEKVRLMEERVERGEMPTHPAERQATREGERIRAEIDIGDAEFEKAFRARLDAEAAARKEFDA